MGGGHRARASAGWVSMNKARITPYRNGPYLVRGDFKLLDQAGNEIDLRRRTVALCRCGRSRNRPFCDGTHKLIGFEASGLAREADGEPSEPR
jgi:CDGSH-type Zn-finger protein